MSLESGHHEGVLERTMQILHCFTPDEPALSAMDIAERTKLAISTVHRLLSKLVEHGLLDRDATHRYSIGVQVWTLGELAPVLLAVREAALPYMQRLHEATGENVHLAVLDGHTPAASRALYIARTFGSDSSPTLGRTGGAFPLHTTGVGKALLATRDEAWLDAYFTVPLLPETVHSISCCETLRKELGTARARGYATTCQEMSLGTASVAVALAPLGCYPPMAIGLAVAMRSFDERRLLVLVRQAASELHQAARALARH